MNVNAYLEQVQNMELENIFGGAEFSLQALTGPVLFAMVLTVLIGVLWCFFGLKLIRVWSAVLGLLIGFLFGFAVATAFDSGTTVALIAGGVVGIVLACLGAVLYHVGVFLVAWVSGGIIAATLIKPGNLVLIILCVVIGLVFAILTVKFAEPVIMVLTGVHGAITLGTIAALFIPVQGTWVRIAAVCVFAILGVWVQFLLESKKRKKQNLKKAEEIREKNSTENEVEKARAMMENLDKISEEDDITYIE